MKRILWMTAAAIALQGATAFADAPNDTVQMLERMQKQMAEMQRTIDRQNARLQQLESRTVVEMPQQSAQISASAPALTQKDWESGIKENIDAAVPWLKGVKMGGDLRLRGENFNFYDDEGVTSDTRDRTRYRFRLRYGLEKDFKDDWKAGFRLASGTAGSDGIATDNTSTNVTLGNPGYFTYKNIYIDRAYAVYSPNGLKDYGAIKGVKVGAGKFDNPFLRHSTPIVWDGDVTPEGLFEQVKLQHVSSEENTLYSDWTFGQFISHENSGAETDAQVYGYQGALTWSTYAFGTETPVGITSALSYYDYPNWFQTVSSNNVGTSFLRTNTRALDNPRVLDWYNEQSFKVGKWPVTLWQDVVSNVGEIDSTREALHEAHGDDFAWGVGIKLGKMKKKHEWEAHWGWYDIGANAVVAAFNDSDFGGPGGSGYTNRVGQKFGLGIMLTDNTSLNYTGYLVGVQDPTNSSSVASNAGNEKVFRSQVDLIWKF